MPNVKLQLECKDKSVLKRKTLNVSVQDPKDLWEIFDVASYELYEEDHLNINHIAMYTIITVKKGKNYSAKFELHTEDCSRCGEHIAECCLLGYYKDGEKIEEEDLP